MTKFDWAVVGSGIAGITIAEILTRQGHSVVLIEKNETLASETTREFHEWLHTGALFTLVPDNLVTLRFILGAIDDLIEFYSSFCRMNILPSDAGLKIKNEKIGWFNDNNIYFKYRVHNRKITFPWLIGIARSIHLVERIHQHDWLRRRAGEISPLLIDRNKRMIAIINELLWLKDNFKTVKTPDFTINSRVLLNDLLSVSLKRGLALSLGNKIENIQKAGEYKILNGLSETIKAERVALCNSEGVKYFSNVKTKTSYAPIAVVSNVPENTNSFVELDYFPKNCINLLPKENGMGLAGGISLSKKTDCDKYLDYVMGKMKMLEPDIEELSRYVGIKSEITFKNQPRGYLYHIVNTENNVWALIPGKFTLAFSMAPEFYRQVYKINPIKYFESNERYCHADVLANTVWQDIYKNEKGQ